MCELILTNYCQRNASVKSLLSPATVCHEGAKAGTEPETMEESCLLACCLWIGQLPFSYLPGSPAQG